MTAIEVEHLTKIYRLYHSPKTDRLRELVSPSRKKYHHDFYALKDVSFTVDKGETVGILGQNGSGKSTLLKIICGVVRPTSGRVTVNGRISSLLELGAGFHPEFTGKENVYMNGALMGLSRAEIDRRFLEVEVFADIGEFIDQPVKTYSSGMFVRLAFASAINIEPDILIIDEALSVGDMFFQSKCVATMNKLIDKGTTLIFVSHDIGAVKKLCKTCILISGGEIVGYGAASTVVEKYFGMKVSSEQKVISSKKRLGTPQLIETHRGEVDHQKPILSDMDNSEFQKKVSFQRIQSGKAGFLHIQLLDEAGNDVASVAYEQRVTLRMIVEVADELPSLICGYHIRDKNGSDVVYSDSIIEDRVMSSPKKGEKYLIDWSFNVSLAQGMYNVACVLSIPTDNIAARVEFCDFVPFALQFTVMPPDGWYLYGSVHWENDVEIRNISAICGDQ